MTVYYLALCVCVQVDPTGSGRVAAADAALFLKRSGLADLVLGKVKKRVRSVQKHYFSVVFAGCIDCNKCVSS